MPSGGARVLIQVCVSPKPLVYFPEAQLERQEGLTGKCILIEI